jgi:hypothetical protein
MSRVSMDRRKILTPRSFSNTYHVEAACDKVSDGRNEMEPMNFKVLDEP